MKLTKKHIKISRKYFVPISILIIIFILLLLLVHFIMNRNCARRSRRIYDRTKLIENRIKNLKNSMSDGIDIECPSCVCPKCPMISLPSIYNGGNFFTEEEEEVEEVEEVEEDIHLSYMFTPGLYDDEK